MARDLVALRVHSLDDGWVYGAWVVNLPLPLLMAVMKKVALA
jgi:hypothetical protein